MDFDSYLAIEDGASIAAGVVAHFGNPVSEIEQATSGSCKTPLTDLGVVGINGPDARMFLQAQLTTDCSALEPALSQLSAWCGPQGRVLFLFRIVDCGDGFEILIPRTEVAGFVQRLSRYVLRAEVEIRDLSDQRVAFGISPAPDETRDPGLAPLPADAFQVTRAGGSFTAIRLDASSRRVLVYGDAAAASGFWRSCPFAPVGHEAWTLLEIRAGLPAIGPATADQFPPQSLNLDLLGAVSFRKGCYPGQEVIMRLKSRGAIKRRTLIARAGVTERPAPGTRLVQSDDDSGNSAGHVLTAARESADRVAMLAVVELNLVESSALCLGGPRGPRLGLSPPPYPLD